MLSGGQLVSKTSWLRILGRVKSDVALMVYEFFLTLAQVIFSWLWNTSDILRSWHALQRCLTPHEHMRLVHQEVSTYIKRKRACLSHRCSMWLLLWHGHRYQMSHHIYRPNRSKQLPLWVVWHQNLSGLHLLVAWLFRLTFVPDLSWHLPVHAPAEPWGHSEGLGPVSWARPCCQTSPTFMPARQRCSCPMPASGTGGWLSFLTMSIAWVIADSVILFIDA